MLDGMSLKISPGNLKIGSVPNLSLPPVKTCKPNVKCAKGCYALKFYRIFSVVRNAWDLNHKLYLEDPERFFNDFCIFLTLKRPERFRLFVGGDFPDPEFFHTILEIVTTYRETSFLCFTKQYDFVKPYVGNIPKNFKLILSMWEGMEVPDIADHMPTAWLSCDDRAPFDKAHIRCPGKCDECGYLCWDAVSTDLPVIFDKH